MVVIGLVGNIGSGKSLAARFLAEKGAAIVDADQIAREIVLPGCPAWQKIVEQFGQAYLLPNRHINRKMLAQTIFNDTASRLRLNAITHPYIRAEAQRRIQEYQAQGVLLIILEAAILLESELIDLVDEVWLVTASFTEIIARVKERDALSEQEILCRLDSQMPAAEQALRADRLIENIGTPDDLQRAISELYDDYVRHLKKG